MQDARLGRSIKDTIQYLTTDTTYGTLDLFLYGHSGKTCEIKIIDEADGTFEMDGISIKLLRNSQGIRERSNGQKRVFRLVIDCTGSVFGSVAFG